MDINEKNPRSEGQSEGGKPRDGKRPGNGGRHNHHRRGGSRPPRPQNNDAAQSQPVSEGEVNAAREAARQPDKRSQPQQSRPQKGGRPDRENRKPENQEQSAPKAKENDRRLPPATGRPQRSIRRAPARADLPDMDNLLIEDTVIANTLHPTAESEAVDAAEVERILERDIFVRDEESVPDVLPEGKVVVAGIRFRTGGKTYFFDPGELTCVAGSYAIVETARGLEFGEVCMGNRMVDTSLVVPPLRPVVRIATDTDIAHNTENREREENAFRVGVEKIREHKLDMKLVSVQYTFDNSKLLFYFTSAGRVDFRELVKDLAGVFHIRIELRQIGIRDEARMIGGLGACGRPLCCTTFLSDFGQVSMKMAKEQNLSLNSTKISGCCGRLMCCLRYEHDTYTEEIKKTPAQGSFVNTPDGPGVVTEIFPLQGEVKVSLRSQTDSAPKRYKREQVELQIRVPRAGHPAEDADEGEPEAENTTED